MPKPPSLFLLQLFNLLVGLGSFLTALTAVAQWNRLGVSEMAIGLYMMCANAGYGAVVFVGGRLSDGWGRARTAALGCAISVLGCGLATAINGEYTALTAAILGFAGPALFFPGNVGLFSDAQAPAADGRHVSLIAKVSRYNLGWSLGNLGGFLGYGLLAERPISIGFGLAGACYLLTGLWISRWVRLPASPPPAEGDRSPHPALARLTLTCRLALLFAGLLGMAQICMLQSTLRASELVPGQAQRLAGSALTAYSACYVGVFLFLGRWSGWVLRPWRLWFVQFGFLLGSIGYGIAAWTGVMTVPLLALCGASVGIAFGACYTGSIYYSLRLPHGAARAASLHETSLGIGNTTGPLLGGGWLWCWEHWQMGPLLMGLAVFMAIGSVTLLVIQAILIPQAVRLGARGT